MKTRPLPKRNAIQIQQDYVDVVTAAHARWQHRKGIPGLSDGIGGHYGRIVRAARAEAISRLKQWGYNVMYASQIMKDAHDVALLEIHAE